MSLLLSVTAGGVVAGVGSASGTSTVNGIGRGIAQVTASSNGVAVVSATGRAITQATASAAGTATVLGIGAVVSAAVGSTTGFATVLGVGEAVSLPVSPPVITGGGGGGGWPFGFDVGQKPLPRIYPSVDWTSPFETTKEFFQPDETGLAPIDREIRDLLLNIPVVESRPDSVKPESLPPVVVVNEADLFSEKERIRKFNLALILLLEAA